MNSALFSSDGLPALSVARSRIPWSPTSVTTPFLLREILDTAIPEQRTGLLSLLALGMIAATVMTSVFGVLQTLISTVTGLRGHRYAHHWQTEHDNPTDSLRFARRSSAHLHSLRKKKH
ncbi:hypothetical protein [Streptomyces sp. 021-3]|uniref:hypothetical protein n=1 Tax=Streptomyces sp. 021-3 TaxID=2789259 RepID=UPI00398185BC